jgi:hypothetical protein
MNHTQSSTVNFVNILNNINIDKENLSTAILERWAGKIESLSEEDLFSIAIARGSSTQSAAGSCFTLGSGPRCRPAIP